MKKLIVKTPAKALLFGEYGVLKGFPAVVAIVPNYFFEIEFIYELVQAGDGKIVVKSDFLPDNELDITCNELECLSENEAVFSEERTEENKHKLFFAGIIAPYVKQLSTIQLEINIKQSFPPSLGFGSSSAIIAAIHGVLFREFNGLNIADNIANNFVNDYFSWPQNIRAKLWENIRLSLLLIQGGGSGYDVGVQFINQLITDRNMKNATSSGQENMSENPFQNQAKLWKYKNTNSPVPELNALEAPSNEQNLGYFVPTNIYSSTTNAVKTFLTDEKKQLFAVRHAAIAVEFLQAKNPWPKLPFFLQKSYAISLAQGLMGENNPKNPLFLLSKNLHAAGIYFKTMGAGFGDCLWVFAEKHELEKIYYPNSTENLAKYAIKFVLK